MRGSSSVLLTVERESSCTPHWQSPPPQYPPDTANTSPGVPRRPGHGTLPLRSRYTASAPSPYRSQRLSAACTLHRHAISSSIPGARTIRPIRWRTLKAPPVRSSRELVPPEGLPQFSA